MAPTTFPLQSGGAAEDAAGLIGARGRLTIEDRTPLPRWGIKGPGSADWLAAKGLVLPEINRYGETRGLTVLRLGGNDVTFLGDPADPGTLDALRRDWDASPAPKGYASWREEGWAWLALPGDGLESILARLTAVDLRPERFDADAIAQTRFAGVDAVLFRQSATFQVFFDITATAAVLRRVAHAADSSAEMEHHP